MQKILTDCVSLKVILLTIHTTIVWKLIALSTPLVVEYCFYQPKRNIKIKRRKPCQDILVGQALDVLLNLVSGIVKNDVRFKVWNWSVATKHVLLRISRDINQDANFLHFSMATPYTTSASKKFAQIKSQYCIFMLRLK